MAFIRVLKVRLKSGDTTLKYSICRSYRCKTSGKALYFSKYLCSIRASELRDAGNPIHRQKFWLKFRMKLDEIGVGKDSDLGELLKISVFASWAKAGYAC